MAESEGTPERPGVSRRSRWAFFGLGSVLHGIAMVALVYLTGLLSLIGDYRQELYVLPGILGGGFLFPVAGELLRRHRTRAAPVAWAAALAVGLGLFVENSVSLVVNDLDLVALSFFCAVGGMPLALVTLPRCSPGTSSRSGYRWALGMGIGPLALGLSYALLYAELDFSGFAWIVLGNEVGLLLLFAIAAVWIWKGELGRLGPAKGPGAHAEVTSPRPSEVKPAKDEGAAEEVVARPTWAPHGGRRPSSLAAACLALAVGGLLLVPAPTARGAPSEGLLVAHSGSVAPTNRTPIQHVVLIMMENHAFDNFFGVYPYGAYPYSWCQPLPNGSILDQLPVPLNLFNNSDTSFGVGLCPQAGEQVANYLPAIPNGTFSTVDPVEGYSPYHLDWDGGKMDGWLQGSGIQGLNYYTAQQLAPEWDLAEEYSLADEYFSSELTETLPNRLYSLAGFSPVINDYGPPPFIPYDQTIFGELGAYGLSWGYYLNDPSAGIGTLNSIEGMTPSSYGIGSYTQFLGEASAGHLPAVSWVEPVDGGLEDQYDQEPPGSVLTGEMWMLEFVDALEESPEWGSTAILITYDEGGGYYDQVAPPTVDGELLGERVPMMIISPYAKESYVSHTVMNHASQLALIDYNWGLPALNGFVADSNLPLDMFDFSAPPRAPFPLTAAEGFPVPTGFPITPPSSPELGGLFPWTPQLPLAERPYASTGSSAVDLASSNASVFVSSDSAFTPVILTLPFLAWLLLVDVAAWVALPKLPTLFGRVPRSA